MTFCKCGQAIGAIRLAGGKQQVVDPFPIHYREGTQDGKTLYTKDGRVVQGVSCRPDASQGIAYPAHRCPAMEDT
jgi:hypothetical protein